MKLDFNLQLRQEQKLIMTQELQMAVKILQLNSIELNEFLHEQIMENPLLDVVENSHESNYEDKKEADFKENIKEFLDYLDYDDMYHSEDYDYDEDYISPLNFVIKETNLWEYLKEQMGLIPLSLNQKMILEFIIDNVDEYGYLTISSKEISNHLKVPEDVVCEMVKILQSFEPAGVGAGDIKECLIIQVRDKGIEDGILENIINNMMEYVALQNTYEIAKQNNISIEKAKEYIGLIKTLDPKPGIRLSGEVTKFIIPDVLVEKVDDKYIVNVNGDAVPTLKVSNRYKRYLKEKETPEYKYVKEKFDSALWLLKSIEQRNSTIKRVVEEIVKYQIDFFDNDCELKPLTLKQIASMADIHESTVSRAVNGKYAQTPKGLFEIKNFFVRGIQGTYGEDISVNKIKDEIKSIIEGEDRTKPYSDQYIADVLKEREMEISRRTVAKYREELGISSSSKRKLKK